MTIESMILDEKQRITQAVYDGIGYGSQRDFQKALAKFEEATSRADSVMSDFPEEAAAKDIEYLNLIARGHSLKAYSCMIKENPANEKQLTLKMEEIARGKISLNNKYFRKIFDVLREFGEINISSNPALN